MLKISKVAAYIKESDFDAAKWRYPVAEELIKTGHMVSVNFYTECVSKFRAETFVPPDGIAMNNAEIGEIVLICSKATPDETLFMVFPVLNPLVN